MPENNKAKISKGKKATIIGLGILVLLVFFLNLFSSARAAESDGRSTFLTRTFNQIGNTFELVSNYARSMVTGDPLALPGEEGNESESETTTNTLAPLPPPSINGTTTILNSVVSRLAQGRGTFIINTNLLANGDIDVTGSATLGDVTVEGAVNTTQLTVLETMDALGLLSALGGITTGGADIDLEGGDLIGIDFVRSIVAGENVEITETDGIVTISVPNIRRGGGGGSSAPAGVASLNGQTGALTLTAGTDIAITGLAIENTSTLESVRLRGGCVGCITDSDVADNLTITGGTINDTVIGALNPASGFFTGISIGTTNTTETLTVTGDASFTGTVSGADAVELDDFVTLSQLNGAIFGGGGGVTSLNALVGALTIVGTSGQVTVTPGGSTITLGLPQNIGIGDSPTFAGLTLSGLLSVTGNADISGVVTASTFVSDVADASVRKSGEEIFRLTASIFPYALPADTGSTSFVRVSKEFTSTFDNPLASAPDPIPGTTRIYKFVIKYADSVPTASDSSWRIYKPSTSSVIDSFTLPGMNKTELDEPEVVVTDPITIPADDWRLEVSVPSGRIRVMDIHMVAFDVVN